jgi:hypothetical protein
MFYVKFEAANLFSVAKALVLSIFFYTFKRTIYRTLHGKILDKIYEQRSWLGLALELGFASKDSFIRFLFFVFLFHIKYLKRASTAWHYRFSIVIQISFTKNLDNAFLNIAKI